MDPELAIPALGRLLDDPVPGVRYSAIYALGRFGKSAKVVVPLLRPRLNSRDRFEQTVAAWSLLQIAPSKEIRGRALPLIVAAVQHDDPVVRAEIARALGEFGGGAPKAREALAKLLNDEDAAVRKAAQAALEKLGT